MEELSKVVRVALDINDVLSDTLSPFIQRVNTTLGTSYKVENFTDPRLYFSLDLIPIFIETWIKDWEKISNLVDRELLTMVSKSYKIEIVTAAILPDGTDPMGEARQKWLELHKLDKFPVLLTPFIDNKAGLDYHVFVDDSPNLAVSLSQDRKKSILLVDKPYNKTIEDSINIRRVPDVNHALRFLLRNAKEAKILKDKQKLA